MLEIKNLTKLYKPKKGVAVKALDDVSIKFADKGLVFILGKSGSGKSTLLNLLGGLDSATSGDIIINNKSTADFSQGDFDSLRNTYVGFIFQEFNILNDFSVGQNIDLALKMQGQKDKDYRKVDNTLKLVDLNGYSDRSPSELSGGQKQRVAIARALVKDPQIILADEPTGQLDSDTGEQIFELLQQLSKEKLVIVVSHDREYAETYGDRVIELKDGKIISDITKGKSTSSTDISALKSDDDFKLNRSRLPLLIALKMGASSLKLKPVRLFITILLCIISFTLFGIADTIAAYDRATSTYDSLVYAKITQSAIRTTHRYETANGFTYFTSGLTHEQANMVINEFSHIDFDVVFNINNFNGDIINQMYSFSWHRDKNPLTRPFWSGVMEVNSDRFEQLGFRVASGDLPARANEIAITLYHAEIMALHDLREFGTNNRIEIDTIDDLIGKNITYEIFDHQTLSVVQHHFIISGVIDTHLDLTRFEPLRYLAPNYISHDAHLTSLLDELEHSVFSLYHCVLFTATGYANQWYETPNPYRLPISQLIVSLPQNRTLAISFINFSYTFNDSNFRFSMHNHLTAYFHMTNFILEIITPLFLWIGLGFSIFAALMFFNYIAISILDKSKEIGILRALGARGKDIWRIFVAQGLIMTIINSIFSIIATIVIVYYLNRFVVAQGIPVVILAFSIRQVGLIVGVGLLTAILASLYPIWRIARQKPVDAIKK